MDSNQRLFQEISREIMKRPITHDICTVPQLHLPISPAVCTAPKEVLAHIKRVNERVKDLEKDRLARQLGQENILRFGYVPLVISELAWDYADTVTDLAEQMKLSKVRPLCRAIKKLRSDYLRYHNRYIDNGHHNCEIENMYVFEKNVSDIFHTYIINLKSDLIREYPDLSAESIMFLTAVYQCRVVILSLLLYAKQQTDKITRIVGRPVREVVPIQVRKLSDLIIEFAGDCPASAEFEKLQYIYIKTLATQIALVELTPFKDK